MNELNLLSIIKPECIADASGLVVLQTHDRVNNNIENFVRAFGCNLFNIHAAFTGGHNGNFSTATIDYYTQIQFSGYFCFCLHQDTVDWLALRA